MHRGVTLPRRAPNMSSPSRVPEASPSTERLARVVSGLAGQSYARRGMSHSNETIRVVLADDHIVVREGLRLLLRTAPDISVVAEASGGEGAVALALQHTPDVLVLDLDM